MEYTPKDANSIPTGEIASVSCTPFDLQQEKVITKELLDAIEGGVCHESRVAALS